MSSKFSGMASTQKEPGVCRKGPPPDVGPPAPFDERTFQGYVNWNDPNHTVQCVSVENIIMRPGPLRNWWTGETTGEPYHIRLIMVFASDPDEFSYSIQLIENGLPIAGHMVLNVPARSMDPFDTGLINFITQPSDAIVRCRIMK